MNIEEIRILIGNRIRSVRKLRQKSLDETAFNAKISRNHLSNIELGRENLTIQTLFNISEYFNLPISYFVINSLEEINIVRDSIEKYET